MVVGFVTMRQLKKTVTIGICALIVALLLSGCSREYGVDEDTGGKCPNGLLGYRCTIADGSYGPYLIGMTIENAYGVICNESHFEKLRYVAITAALEETTDKLIAKYDPLRATYAMKGYPYGHATFYPEDASQCAQMARELDFVRDIFVRRNGFLGGDGIFLNFEDRKLIRLTLSKVFPLNEL